MFFNDLKQDTKLIPTSHLMEDNYESKNKRVHLQLLRIIAGKKNTNDVFQWQKRKYGANKTGTFGSGTYTRMFLFRDMMSSTGDVLQMIEHGHRNKDLWSRDISIRDDGRLTIGSCISIMEPYPIEDYLAGDIPLLDSGFSSLVLKTPDDIPRVNINEGIAQGITKSFVLRNAEVSVKSSVPIQSNCSGLFCDKQNVEEVLSLKRGCGCYSMQERISNVTMVHKLKIVDNGDDGTDIQFFVPNFSSTQFERLFLAENMPSSITKKDFDYTKKFRRYRNAVETIMGQYNYGVQNEGFTVIGWYKRGKIQDKSNENDTSNIDNSEIFYHIVYLKPETCEALAGLESNKFDPRE